MNIHQDRPASSGQWLGRHDLLNFITTLYEGDLHAKRVLSLANATVGVLTSASLAIHAVGRGLAQAMGTLTKHGVKQVDRLLSNRGVDVWAFFAYWTPFIVGARTEVVVALDWTSFAADGQDTIVLSMVTGHGRATPLLWKTVASSTLKGNQRRYEYEVLCRLREVLPAGVKVTVVADRGFGDCKLFYALTTELALEYVIRLRGDISVTSARGERRAAAAWVGAGGRARRLVGARVTDTYELPVGVVVCVHDPKMDEPWCLVASEATVPTRVLIRYYGKRWGIEAGFRDIKDMRFGMGLSSMHVSRPDRRDRLLLISALAIAVLSLLGAARLLGSTGTASVAGGSVAKSRRTASAGKKARKRRGRGQAKTAVPELQFGYSTDRTGFTPAGIAAFSDLRPAAVVRELIQNSLDAALIEAGEPCARVRFERSTCTLDEIPGIMSYRTGVSAGGRGTDALRQRARRRGADQADVTGRLARPPVRDR